MVYRFTLRENLNIYHNIFLTNAVVCVSCSVYNGLVGFASPLVTDKGSDCASPTSVVQTSFAAGTRLYCVSVMLKHLEICHFIHN